jgi:hypothetical protein
VNFSELAGYLAPGKSGVSRGAPPVGVLYHRLPAKEGDGDGTVWQMAVSSSDPLVP